MMTNIILNTMIQNVNQLTNQNIGDETKPFGSSKEDQTDADDEDKT